MKPTWILVANSSQARMFAAESSTDLEEIQDFFHKESCMHEHEITSDQSGEIVGKAGRHAYQSHISPKQQEVINFAKKIARHIDQSHKENKFRKLMLVADPSFLGELRKQLSDEVSETISFELDKNLAAQNVDDIRQHLPKYLL